jgi:hypothetical protein
VRQPLHLHFYRPQRDCYSRYCTVQYSRRKLSSVHVLHNTPYETVERILLSYFLETKLREYRFIDPPKTPHNHPNMVNKATLSFFLKDFVDYFGCAFYSTDF